MSERTELPSADAIEKKQGTCATCHHWHLRYGFGVTDQDPLDTTDDPWGNCERYPPVLVDPDKALGEDGWEQPPTLHFMRCGEWKANGGAKGSGDPPTLRLSRPKPPASPKIPDGETSLVDLELSVRAHNLIEMSGIATIEQLARYTAAQIRAIHGFGIASVIEVRAKLAARGLKLSGE